MKLDLEAGECTLYALASLSLKLGQILRLGLYFGIKALRSALAVRRRRGREGRLQSAGTAVPGTIVQVRRHSFIRWERESFSSWPGQGSPWSVRCTYEYGDRTYGVDSGLLWKEPAQGLQHPTVYVDPTHHKRAWVDLDTVVLLA